MPTISTFFEAKATPFHNRTFLNAILWKQLSDAQYVWCACPIAAHPSVQPGDESHAVRAEVSRCIRLTLIAENATMVEYACTMDLKGHLPKWFTNRVAIPTLVKLPYALQVYFAQIRPIDTCKAEDGTFIGHMLMNAALDASKARRAEAVAAFVSCTEALRKAPLVHLDILLHYMICKKSLKVLAGDISTHDPAQLTAADAETIGDGITRIRRGHVAPVKAVAEVFAKYDVLRATAQLCPWFEPMLAVVITRLMAASIGTRLRLSLSTALSMLDIGSDLFTMLVYYLASEFETGSLILATVCLNIAGQALVVFYRNRHRSAGEIVTELLIILSFCKPVIDLRRLMHGHEFDGAPIDTATERSFCKAAETACESVPASIIAMVALILSGRWTWAPIMSIFISWISTAFKTTSLSFDLDTDRAKRMRNPNFYGFVPCSSVRRRIAYACLFVLAFAHIVERTAALTLLFVTRKAWVGVLVGTELGVFLLYKMLRSDFIVWVPGMGYGASLMYRAVSKLLLDFCGLPQMRHPYEAGGAVWLFSIFMNQVVCLLSVWAYSEHYDGPYKLECAMLFITFGALGSIWAVALAGFFLAIERTYLRTFVSFETGRALAVRLFREANDDESRIEILNSNRCLWESIREEVEAWLQAKYAGWKSQPPPWLTPGLLAKIPKKGLGDSESALVRRHKGVRGLDGDLV
jgi:hypothetical protein